MRRTLAVVADVMFLAVTPMESDRGAIHRERNPT